MRWSAFQGPWTIEAEQAAVGARPARMPGPISSRDIASRRSSAFQTHVANDADLAAIGEATAHTGERSTDMAYLTISTGIGAGVVLGGELVSGNRSLAELGHTVIDWRAWRNGQAATLEELASGTGVARQAREAGLGDLDAAAVATLAGEGDPRASSIWLNAIAAGAAGVANMVMSFSPSLVVIGGGLGRREGFFEPLRQLVMRHRARLQDDLDARLRRPRRRRRWHWPEPPTGSRCRAWCR